MLRNVNIRMTMANLIEATVKQAAQLMASYPLGKSKTPFRAIVTVAFAILLTSCAAYGPYHANTASKPFNSVRGP